MPKDSFKRLYMQLEENGLNRTAACLQLATIFKVPLDSVSRRVDEVFDEADEDARDRPIGEAGDQRGQLRHIQLDESGHDGDGKFQVHEHGGHSAKHGGTRKNADFAGRVLHNKMPPVKK